MEIDAEALVCELIEEERQQWDMQKISATFPESVATLIQGIPLGKSNAEDLLIWDYEEKGCYTVKIGYRLLMGSNDD